MSSIARIIFDCSSDAAFIWNEIREMPPSASECRRTSSVTSSGRFAADDRDHQWQAEFAGAHERRLRTADAEPDRQRILDRPRIHALSGQRRTKLAGPLHVFVLANVQQQIELLGEQRATRRVGAVAERAGSLVRDGVKTRSVWAIFSSTAAAASTPWSNSGKTRVNYTT